MSECNETMVESKSEMKQCCKESNGFGCYTCFGKICYKCSKECCKCQTINCDTCLKYDENNDLFCNECFDEFCKISIPTEVDSHKIEVCCKEYENLGCYSCGKKICSNSSNECCKCQEKNCYTCLEYNGKYDAMFCKKCDDLHFPNKNVIKPKEVEVPVEACCDKSEQFECYSCKTNICKHSKKCWKCRAKSCNECIRANKNGNDTDNDDDNDNDNDDGGSMFCKKCHNYYAYGISDSMTFRKKNITRKLCKHSEVKVCCNESKVFICYSCEGKICSQCSKECDKCQEKNCDNCLQYHENIDELFCKKCDDFYFTNENIDQQDDVDSSVIKECCKESVKITCHSCDTKVCEKCSKDCCRCLQKNCESCLEHDEGDGNMSCTMCYEFDNFPDKFINPTEVKLPVIKICCKESEKLVCHSCDTKICPQCSKECWTCHEKSCDVCLEYDKDNDELFCKRCEMVEPKKVENPTIKICHSCETNICDQCSKECCECKEKCCYTCLEYDKKYDVLCCRKCDNLHFPNKNVIKPKEAKSPLIEACCKKSEKFKCYTCETEVCKHAKECWKCRAHNCDECLRYDDQNDDIFCKRCHNFYSNDIGDPVAFRKQNITHITCKHSEQYRKKFDLF